MINTFDINNFEDEAVWDLICNGDTKGVFQLESNLGRHWAKQTKPRNIKDLSALVSLIRPGTLLAKDITGKSMTQVYADRKAAKSDSPVEYLHSSLEPILKETYGVLVYQEQSMLIAQRLAGFNLKEADGLRKAIGKKKADLMAKVKKSFLAGAEKEGIVTREIADEIFSWIEKSSRYAFNKSHAVSYAINAYWSAYCKCYRRQQFYETYLNKSDKKPKPDIEKKQLMSDARMSDINVLPPRLRYLKTNFTLIQNSSSIIYGLRHIKGVSVKTCKNIEQHLADFNVVNYDWMDSLIKMIHTLNIDKRSAIAMISVGAFNGANNRLSREQMLYEYNSWKQLTKTEQEWISMNHHSGLIGKSLSESIENILLGLTPENTKPKKVSGRRDVTVKDIKYSLDNPFYSLDDSVVGIASLEEKYLSYALTCSKVDAINLQNSINMCKDIANSTIIGKAIIAVEIERLKIVKTKKGKNPGQSMAFLTVEDGSGSIDSVIVFPDCFAEFKNSLTEQNTVMLHGEVPAKDRSSFIVNKVTQI